LIDYRQVKQNGVGTAIT